MRNLLGQKIDASCRYIVVQALTRRAAGFFDQRHRTRQAFYGTARSDSRHPKLQFPQALNRIITESLFHALFRAVGLVIKCYDGYVFATAEVEAAR